MWFGQLVIGPPGSGKTTYCNGMQQMLRALQRKHIIVNIDPANELLPVCKPKIIESSAQSDVQSKDFKHEHMQEKDDINDEFENHYDCDIDIRDLVNFNQIMDKYRLGPNGALVYCMEYLVANFEWFSDQLKKHPETYIIIDCPGQVELYSHHTALSEFIQKLTKINCRLTAVHLIDSTFCTDPFKYISALLVCLNGQIQLELPHLNVLTKIDLLKHYKNDLDMRIDFYAEAQELSHLLLLMKDKYKIDNKFSQFNSILCELIEDFNIVGFRMLDIQDKYSVIELLKEIDHANGFSLMSIYSDLNIFNISITPVHEKLDLCGDIQERYIDISESED